MKTATIKELAYLMKLAKEDNLPQPIVFLGAGASKSGGIPLASEIVDDILEKYKNNPRIVSLTMLENTYPRLMECLTPNERNKLLKGYIDFARINVTHIYLAQLITHGYIDYVLTVNFDNLMLRALALFNEFPSTYDMAVLKDLTTTTFKKKSVVYLHGQHHGLWLLNTKEETEKVKEVVSPILHSIKERPWIFVGYSGEDPIFDHIKGLGRFDDGLYWVSHHDNDPSETVCKNLLEKPNTNAFLIKGYDADSFMLKLNTELGLHEPAIIDKPFTLLKELLNNIEDIDDDEHFKGVKQRLEIVKGQVNEAIQQFEEGNVESHEKLQENTELDLLKKEIIDLLIKEDYPEDKINEIDKKIQVLNNVEINNLFAGLHSNWGNQLGKLAKAKSGAEAQSLYQLAFEKHQKAIDIKPDYHEAFSNWGTHLGNLAQTKSGDKADALYNQAFEKFSKAIDIKPDYPDAFYNWGTFLGKLAETKSGEEAQSLYKESFEKFRMAIDIKPNDNKTFNNWGTYLGNLAQTKSGDEAQSLYKESFEKFRKAIDIKPSHSNAFFNWGTYLGNLAKTKSGDEAQSLYQQAFEKFRKAIDIKPNDHKTFNNWGTHLGNLAQTNSGDEAQYLYEEAQEKYRKAIELKPDSHEVFNCWGVHLGNVAKTKSGEEAESLFQQTIEKFRKAIDIKSDFYEAFNNWGVHLGNFAKTKSGEEAESLFQQTIEKFRKAIDIKLDFYEAFSNLGIYLGNFAKTKSGDEAELLYQQAIEKHLKAIDLGEGSYNLACTYALKSDKENALLYLKKSLENKEIKVEFVKDDEDWKNYLEDEDLKEIISLYENS